MNVISSETYPFDVRKDAPAQVHIKEDTRLVSYLHAHQFEKASALLVDLETN